MPGKLDLNLLTALHALLEEGSVGGAAARLHLSEPAMSRALGRIRRATGDPVLVRAGRSMVPTPRALALREEVRELVDRAQALLGPPARIDPGSLEQTFTIVASDGWTTLLAGPLTTRLRGEAPGVGLRFLPEAHDDTPVLRDGTADLLISADSTFPPETRVEPLFSDRPTGMVRAGHPLLDAPVTAAAYAAADHVVVSRRGRTTGPVDQALAALGLARRVAVTVSSHTSQFFLLADTDLVGMGSRLLSRTPLRALGLQAFDIPLELPEFALVQSWHPRYDADGAHIWLRTVVRETVLEVTRGP